jgi:hypothetical protein
MEGVSNILLLGFQTIITKKYQEITNNIDFSLPIPRERYQTLVSPRKFTIQDQENKHPRGVHHSSSSIHCTIKHFHKRETPQFPRIEKISAKYFSQ